MMLTSSPPDVLSGSLSDEEVFHCAAECTSAEHQYTEAQTVLERRVSDGQMIIGDCNNKTRLVKRIGGGSFGEVYLGITDAGVNVAVKVELSNSPCAPRCILHEGDVYRKLSGGAGIPNMVWFGMHGTDYSALVMDLLGPTLYGAWSKLGEQFSMKTLLMIVDQTLETITAVHTSGFVHRDISPSNFMLNEAGDRIYLIDFGQAKKTATKLILASRKRFSLARPVVGTPRFASVFAHAGMDPSFRDDLEALGYMWIYLGRGRLPWQGIRDCCGAEKIAKIGQMKLSTPVEELCAGLPEEFAVYLTYVRSLRQHDMPDHAAIRDMFRQVGERLGVEYDWKFDWVTAKEAERLQVSTSSTDQESFTESSTTPETPVSE